MQQSKKTVSIKDVAAYVGLSVGTVSMALNDSDKIASKTKEVVKKAAEEIGFRDDYIYNFIKNDCKDEKIMQLNQVERAKCLELFKAYKGKTIY